ncbi:hypothetical protein [Nonomuraea zeae]|uniref:Uncharacterized protein n=1 Tax=Nonomuraea zeae TaxID=1642303 RepID=A0A5S4GMI3_9ACTN|nr:hypothetical protein [Nonomuraea zeae]TMR34155.1 hypothetical protein ETD85_17795 [Nonomuraea zeae]
MEARISRATGGAAPAGRGEGTATTDLIAELLRCLADLFQAADPGAGSRLLEIRALLAQRDDLPARPVDPAARAGDMVAGRVHEAPVVSCRRRGRRWRIELAGRTADVRDSVGMNHLAVLLANPCQEIPALELATGSALTDRPAAQEAAGGQPLLDDLAKRRYKQRLSQLQAEIEEFETMNDLERAAAARAERDWLLDEVAAATRLGGRARHFTGNAERARVAVGKAIRRTLDVIEEADPLIGGELRATVRTGMRCSYRPA